MLVEGGAPVARTHCGRRRQVWRRSAARPDMHGAAVAIHA